MLELDHNKIKRLADQRENENFSFRAFLKGQDGDNVDRIVHELNKDISSQIDCKSCGNCCKVLRPYVSDSDIDFFSKKEGLSKRDFFENFVDEDQFDKKKYLKVMPCKYLDGKTCSIYNDRPDDCKSYPHMHKDEFVSRTLGVINNYEICPIVFNLYERLKIELKFK